MQEYIVGLQELLKNGQMVDKNFAFCPVKEDSGTKKIHDPSSISTNMTLLSSHFKISSTKGRNPFEKQKVFKNNKEVKGDLKNPISISPWQSPPTRSLKISWQGLATNGIDTEALS